MKTPTNAKIKADEENIRTFKLTATVSQASDWVEALVAAGPATPIFLNVREAGNQYLPTQSGEEKVDFVLRNYPKGDGGWNKARKWAEAEGLKPTNPREMFAAVEQYNLHEILEVDLLCVAATTSCVINGYLKTVCVNGRSSNRIVCASSLENFVHDGVWFLFRK